MRSFHAVISKSVAKNIIPNMKIIVFSILLIGIISCGHDDEFNVDCLPSHLQNGLIAFYPFNGGSLDDVSTNTNNIINPTTANTTTDRNGNSNCAYQFDNSQTDEEFLTTSNSNFLNGLDAFSVSIWYEPMDTTRSGGSLEVLLGRGDEGRCPDRRGEWSIGLYDCRRAVFGHNNSVWANIITGFPNGCQEEVVALTDKWHHVVATKNGDEYNIYFNGNLDESSSGNANCSNLHLAEDIGDMFIGSKYTGKIDDILIYNRELSESEVTALFELEPCCQ
jgi:hypothetical protein